MIEIKSMIEIIEKIFSDKKVESITFTTKDAKNINKAMTELEGYNIAWEFSGDNITFLIVENEN